MNKDDFFIWRSTTKNDYYKELFKIAGEFFSVVYLSLTLNSPVKIYSLIHAV